MRRQLEPEMIRRVALDILSNRKEGIKQAELFRATEAFLSLHYIVPDHSIKNALWDLSDRYSDFVIKKKPSYREVWLYPSSKLIEESPIDLPEFAESVPYKRHFELESVVREVAATSSYAADDDAQVSQLASILSFKVLDLGRYAEFSEIDGVISELMDQYSTKLRPKDLEKLVELRLLLRSIRSMRTYFSNAFNYERDV